ncbi:hypothetical protein XW60_24285 [Mycobacteroides abscessus subsp. bolletii]|nr:hypothetical protein XW60_24285 [Mycobacteroides abscessus subsp. bolletii]
MGGDQRSGMDIADQFGAHDSWSRPGDTVGDRVVRPTAIGGNDRVSAATDTGTCQRHNHRNHQQPDADSAVGT